MPFCSISAVSITASMKFVLFLVLLIVKKNKDKMLNVGKESLKKQTNTCFPSITVLLSFVRITQCNVIAIILQITDFPKHCLRTRRVL